MQTEAVNNQPNRKPLPSAVKWAAGLSAVLLACVALVYFWRVFYSYGQYPFAHISAGVLTAVLCGFGALGTGIFWAVRRFVKSFSARAAIAVFCVGLLVALIDPPFQVPDETQHYLRAYAISEGRLDFDATRTYPDDVQALVRVFSMAWTSAHGGSAIKARTEGEVENPAPEQTLYGECISDRYADYVGLCAGDAEALERYGSLETNRVYEPVLFVVLPLLPQALGIALARLLGFGALGALYGARIANLAVYALLCWAALKGCRRYRPVFCAVMLLPLSLFLAASCSYDASMLGLYLFAASYFCRDEITDRDLVWFGLAFALMVSVKSNNLLWIVLPLVLPQKAWKARLKKWQAALLVLAAFGLLYVAITVYNGAAICNYGTIARMIPGVHQEEQLSFMLQNPLRTLAVFWGSLLENDFFLTQLGVFGNVDLNIPVLGVGSVGVMLLGSALSVHRKSSLTPRSCAGLLGLSLVYAASVLAGLYVTYTPVSMVRVIGMQARYFLPCMLMVCILVAALLSHVLEPSDAGQGTERAARLGLGVSTAFGLVGALLLFQYYFVGPVSVVPLAA